MDKLRPILAVMGKQRFWILSGIVTLLALPMWFLATSDVAAETETNVGKVKQLESKVNGIKSTEEHPNENIIEIILADVAKQRDIVFTLWQQLYKTQQETALIWPNFYEGFQKEIQGKAFGEPIASTYRGHYDQWMKRRLGELAKIVGATELDPETFTVPRPASPVGGGEELLPDPPIVIWETDQTRIYQHFNWDNPPSAWKMWFAQEDKWVYETMLEAIYQANMLEGEKPATGPHNASIKEIVSLLVGADAAALSNNPGRIIFTGTRAAEGGFGGPDGMGEGMGMGAGGGMDTGMGEDGGGATGEMGEEAEKAMLMNGRYLDPAGKPIFGAGAEGTDPLKTEFRRLPITMSLVMNQRKIPELVVACANGALPIEVTKVSINPELSDTVAESSEGGGGGGGGAMGGGMGAMGAMGAMGGGGGGFGGTGDEGEGGMGMGMGGGYGGGFGGGNRNRNKDDEENPAIVPVVIQGVVYIYNPPDKAALGVVDAEADPADADATDENDDPVQ